jgi:hypothetical protein
LQFAIAALINASLTKRRVFVLMWQVSLHPRSKERSTEALKSHLVALADFEKVE